MTYHILAVFPEGSYKVAESNCPDHGMDVAEKVCKVIDRFPHAFVTYIPGKHKYNGNIFSLCDLKKR